MSENFWKYTVALIIVVFVIWLLYMYMSPSSQDDSNKMHNKSQTSHQVGQTGKVCPRDDAIDNIDCNITNDHTPAESKSYNFNKFVSQIKQEAYDMGFKESVISKSLDNAKFYNDIKLPKVMIRDYDNLRSISEIMLFVSDDDIKEIRDQYVQLEGLITSVARKLNIDPKILGTIYLLRLQNYKKNLPERNVFDILMSMLYRHPSSKMVRHELFTAIILVSDGLDPNRMLSMNDGSMGVIRFFPSEYLHYATSKNKKKQPDIWNNPYDSMMSLGRFLLKHGLKANYKNHDRVFMIKVDIPEDRQHALSNMRSGKVMHRCLSELVQITNKQTLPNWYHLDIKQSNGNSLPQHKNEFYLIRDTSDNVQNKGFLVDDNYFTILDYSCSHKFALHVLSIISRL